LFNPDPAHLLLAALMLDAVAGDMPALFRLVPHPIVLAGRAIAWAETRLNRPELPAAARRGRGILLCSAMVLAAAALGWGLSFAWPIEIVVAAVLIAQRGLFDHVRAVAQALETGGEEAGRMAVSHIVGRDPASLDRHGIARAAIESLAENFSDAVAAPVFWYLLGGLPGLLVYKTVNTLDSMVGYRSERYLAFGWASARLDDLLNLIPARLSALLLALAAFSPAALKTAWRDHPNHRSPNSGWPEAAMAGALGLALAGPRVYAGQAPEGKWIGDGRREAEPADIRKALRVFVIACGLVWACVAGLASLP
jgi:adenosylcobinamide-phosphate synthase